MGSLSANDAERAYQLIKNHADRIVNENIAFCKQNVAATIDYESIMLKRAEEDRNALAASHHKTMIEIYKSILERI